MYKKLQEFVSRVSIESCNGTSGNWEAPTTAEIKG